MIHFQSRFMLLLSQMRWIIVLAVQSSCSAIMINAMLLRPITATCKISHICLKFINMILRGGIKYPNLEVELESPTLAVEKRLF